MNVKRNTEIRVGSGLTALNSSLWLISLLHYLSYALFFCGLVSLMDFVFPKVFWKCALIFTQSTGYVLMLCLGEDWNHNFLKGWNSLPIRLLFIVHDPLEFFFFFLLQLKDQVRRLTGLLVWANWLDCSVFQVFYTFQSAKRNVYKG